VFCVSGVDANGKTLTKDPCPITAWRSNWATGETVTWKFKSGKLEGNPEAAKPYQVAKLEIKVSKVTDLPIGSERFSYPCKAVYPVFIQAATKTGFAATASDMAGGVASFQWTKGANMSWLGAPKDVKAFTLSKSPSWWNGFRVDGATANFRDTDQGCTVEMNATYAGYHDGWTVLTSNGQMESTILKAVADDLEKNPPASSPAGSDITGAKNASEQTALFQISSEPAGAEIEIDGEYHGNTPSSIKLAPGAHTIKITKKGFAPWERKMQVQGGESRTVSANLGPGS
jgi:hypothetical protein